MANDKIKFKDGTVVDSSLYLYQVGVKITATAAELNNLASASLVTKDVTATAAELNRVADLSARVVTTTATALSLTVTQHSDRVLIINTNSTVANTFTLPAATGSGAKYTVINNIAQTQGSIVITCGTTDVMKGVAYLMSTTEEAAEAFLTSATSDKISLNAGTTGGLGGDRIEIIDTATSQYTVTCWLSANATLATPFSET